MDLIKRNRIALKDRQPGDIVFFHPETFNPIANLICWISNQYYHHGAIVISDHEVIEGDPGKGVHRSCLFEYMESYTLDLFRLKDSSKADTIVANAKELIGWGYDYKNVLWAGLGWSFYWVTGLNWFRILQSPVDEEKSVHSEEFIDLVFYKSGIDLRERIPSTNITAQDLSESSFLYKVNS